MVDLTTSSHPPHLYNWASHTEALALTVVAPMFNEAGGAAGLVAEIAAALSGVNHEIVIVDDNSEDETVKVLKGIKHQFPQLRVVQHGRNSGQSRAIRTGVLAARAPLSR